MGTILILGKHKTADANRGIKSPEGMKFEKNLDNSDKQTDKASRQAHQKNRILNKGLDAKIKSINSKAKTEVSALVQEKKKNDVANNKTQRSLEASSKQVYKVFWAKIQAAEKAYKKSR